MEEANVKILLAEDDENLGALLREYLIAKGFKTDLFVNGELALAGFKKNKYDICILDVMMPKMDGFTLAREIKKINSAMPYIFLTAKSLKEDVLEGFSIGADDYITKPFSMEELMFRIKAILRRLSTNNVSDTNETYTIGEYVFDSQKQILEYNKKQLKLTTKESELLKLLCNNKNNVLERNFALKTIWQEDSYFNARSMDVYITKLRKYLKEDKTIQILNIHGKGYKLIV
ncbi:MAG: two-component system response regulator [Bacteroidetes bacterium GWF2_33_16]|nr:MAG: two-component system response regulator [Bacteroidetes bacterium GWE2_32_14]OFY03882.1 MAG: two-component system response regulator [Bacteroidetes bacterium GWF2_33_16]